MAETLYATTTVVSGTCTSPNNFAGVPDGTFTGDTGNTNWTCRWGLQQPVGILSGTQTLVVTVRKQPGQTGNPTLNTINFYDGSGTVVATASGGSVTSGTSQTFQLQFDASVITNTTSYSIELVTTGVGGAGGVRASVQADGVVWTANVITLTTVSASETATVSVTESTSILANVAKTASETATVSVSESTNVQNVLSTVPGTDAATVGVSESWELVIFEGSGSASQVTWVGTSSVGNGSYALINFTRPAAVQADDVVVMHLARWIGEPDTLPAPSVLPSGSVLIGSQTLTAVQFPGQIRSDIIVKRVGAETSWETDFGNNYWANGTALFFRGVDAGVNLASLVPQFATAGTQTTSMPSVSITAATGDGVAFFATGCDNDTAWTGTPPTGFTERREGDLDYAASRDNVTAGTVTASGGTASNANVWITTLVDFPAAIGSQTQTNVKQASDTASITGTGTASVDTGGTQVPQSASDTATVSVSEATNIVTTDYINTPGADTATISVTESTNIVVQSEKYITSISANGRYFLDQNGDPILLRGLGPWGALFNNTPAELEDFWIAMKAAGFNTAQVSLLPDQTNGADSASGQTFDGIAPFTTFPTLNETYWARMDAHIDMAANYGFTLLVYPVDSWTAVSGNQTILGSASNTDLATYGTTLAQRWADKPNIIWMTGGDYYEPYDDAKMAAALDAIITELGASNVLTSAMLIHPEWTMRQTTGAWSEGQGRADFNFLYVYDVTYDLTQKAYAQHAFPVLNGENKYLGEGATATIFRRCSIWALTAGAAGDMPFTLDWAMGHNTWQDTFVNNPDPDFFQAQYYHGWFASRPGWWNLVPDLDDSFILTGRGTKINRTDFTEGDNQTARAGTNDYATAMVKADGSMAVCYVPTQRAITLNLTELNANPVAKWVHPTTLAETAIADPSVSITPPAAGDWLLYITADTGASPVAGSDTASISTTEVANIVVVSDTKAATETATVSVTESTGLVINTNVPGAETATVGVTESVSIAGTAATTDTATVSVSESASVVVVFQILASADSATVSVIESRQIVSSLSRADTATVSVTESSSISGQVAASDSASITVTDVGGTTVTGNNPSTSDVAYMTVAEVASIYITTPGVETATVSVAEVASIFAATAASDTAQPSVTESTSFGGTAAAASDTAQPSVTENASVVVVSQNKAASDTATVTTSATAQLVKSSNPNEGVVISVTEVATITVSVSASDTASVSVTEASSANSSAPFQVQYWSGAALGISGQVQYWDGTQLVPVALSEPLVWDGAQFVPYSTL